jgi:uncharacterized protein (TIGR02145 family)
MMRLKLNFYYYSHRLAEAKCNSFEKITLFIAVVHLCGSEKELRKLSCIFALAALHFFKKKYLQTRVVFLHYYILYYVLRYFLFTYFSGAIMINRYPIFFLLLVIFIIVLNGCEEEIDSQCWLKENLDIGTMIQGAQEQTNNGIVEKYCYEDNIANCNVYGGLYQWNEAMEYSTTPGTQGICPSGWHIPSSAEFYKLMEQVKNDENSLKAEGQGTGAGASKITSGFSAKLAGYRYSSGHFFGYVANFWSSTESSAANSFNLTLFNQDSRMYYYYDNKANGFSVRCLKD